MARLKYSGLLDGERLLVRGIQLKIELSALKHPDDVTKRVSPETAFNELVEEANLAGIEIIDKKRVLNSYYGGKE